MKLRGFIEYGVAILIALALLFCTTRYLLPALLPFLAAAVIAMLLRPLACTISHVTRMHYRASAVAAALLFYGLGATLAVSIGFLIFAQTVSFFTQLPELFTQSLIPAASSVWEQLSAMVTRLLPTASLYMGRLSQWTTAIVGEALSKLSTSVLHWAGSTVSALPSAVFAIFIGLLSSVLMLVDYDRIVGFISRLLTPRLQRLVSSSKRVLLTTGKNFVKAYFLLMLLTFAEVSTGLWLLRVEYFAVLGLIVAVVDVLPILGSGAVLIPWGLWLLLGGSIGQGVGVLLLYGVVAVVRTIAEPKILGDRLGLPPLVTLASMYLGLRFMGVAGLILTPMAVTLLIHLGRQGQLGSLHGGDAT